VALIFGAFFTLVNIDSSHVSDDQVRTELSKLYADVQISEKHVIWLFPRYGCDRYDDVSYYYSGYDRNGQYASGSACVEMFSHDVSVRPSP